MCPRTVTSETTRQFHCGVGEIVKSLDGAGVLTMPTLFSCVPLVLNHLFLLVVVFLSSGTGGRREGSRRKWFCVAFHCTYALIRFSVTPLLFRTRPSHVGDIALV